MMPLPGEPLTIVPFPHAIMFNSAVKVSFTAGAMNPELRAFLVRAYAADSSCNDGEKYREHCITVYDRMVDILGEGDTLSLLSPLIVDARVRLLKDTGINLNATTQSLEARISQLNEEGRALEESLQQSEGQAKPKQ
ncbi:hypothetical protein DYB32_007323 [Aphanomyces invadans]|uniref:Uncharacterized protein n=1 Tax=Aphanomyces invadans TaxID=157072 RepID=A0A418AP45_9STRA|nr:hypothetical protein DYB32_007323 [Aphanomyces invadans]